MTEVDVLLVAIRRFLEDRSQRASVKDEPVPGKAERRLLETLEREWPPTTPSIALTRAWLDGSDSGVHALLWFAHGMAEQAVRRELPRWLTCGSLGLVLDTEQLDSRDVLLACAVLDDASRRLGRTFEQVMGDALAVAAPGRRGIIVNGWMRHEACGLSRRLESMGMRALGEGASFRYVTWP